MLIGYYLSIYRQLNSIEDGWRMFNPSKLSKFDKSVLVKFSLAESNYDEWDDQKKLGMGFNPRLQDWVTPSINLMAQLLLFHEEFLKLGPFYGSPIDCNNLWIVKPASNARGHGIFVTNDIEDIVNEEKNDITGKDTLVQKYIESPLLIEIEENEYKFDIRQWVLVTCLSPLTIFIFDGFYCRMCSNPYDVDNFKDTSRHLTNYSVNKDNFKQGAGMLKQSAMDDIFLKEYLKETRGIDWDTFMQPKIEEIVIEALRASTKNMVQRERSFEVYGFDILIDSVLNPYLLEVNLSPACEEREEFLAKMLQDMTTGLFSILKEREIELNENRAEAPQKEKPAKGVKQESQTTPESLSKTQLKLEPIISRLKIESELDDLKYRWKHIYSEDQDEIIIRPGSDNFLCVKGQTFNVKLEAARDRKMKEQ